MHLNSRRNSEIFNYFFLFRNAVKLLSSDIEENKVLSELWALAQEKPETDTCKLARSRYLSLKEKFAMLKEEVEDFPILTMGGGLSVDEYQEKVEISLETSNYIDFHYIQKHSGSKHEIIYTIKSDQEINLIYLLYAPEIFMGSSRITRKTVINYLQEGGIGVKIAHPYPCKIGSKKTEMVTVLLDDVDSSKNYYFQIYVLSPNGYQMSDPLRLVLNKSANLGRSKSIINDKESFQIYLTNSESFIRNSYAARSANSNVQSVFERTGSPSNNSRYDKGG